MRGTVVLQKHAANWDLHPYQFGCTTNACVLYAGQKGLTSLVDLEDATKCNPCTILACASVCTSYCGTGGGGTGGGP